MEVSNQMLAVLMLVLFIANYYVVLTFSKALEKASYKNMLTLMRELKSEVSEDP